MKNYYFNYINFVSPSTIFIIKEIEVILCVKNDTCSLEMIKLGKIRE